MPIDTKTPDGFSAIKGEPNYWTDAVRDFWAETDLDTDSEELRWIVNWFDTRRNNGSSISRVIN